MFQNKNYKNFNIKKAFTLTEVLVVSLISSIILGFIFLFLSDIVEGIGNTKKEVGVLGEFYEFTEKLNNSRNIYVSGSILTNNIAGNDVFLMRNSLGTEGMLVGPVKMLDTKISINDNIYDDVGIGFRKLSALELAEIDADINKIYNIFFQYDKIFSQLKVKELYLESYNSGSIINMQLVINTVFHSSLIGENWSNAPKKYLKEFNIDF